MRFLFGLLASAMCFSASVPSVPHMQASRCVQTGIFSFQGMLLMSIAGVPPAPRTIWPIMFPAHPAAMLLHAE